MRISPLIVWYTDQVKNGTQKEYENLKKVIKADVEFTHPEKLSQHCCVLYAVAITYLLNNSSATNKNVGAEAFKKCYELSDTSIANFKADYDKSTKKYASSCKIWLEESKKLA